MNKPLTLITPCYKTATYFMERLSISVMHYSDLIEWIIIDDTPYSDCVEAGYCKIKKTIKDVTLIKHEKNLGISESYKTGIRAAKGQYIAILDHDDELSLSQLLPQLVSALKIGYDLIYTGESRFNNTNLSDYHKPLYDPLSALYYFYPHHLSLFRRDIVNEIIEKQASCLDYAVTTFDIALWYEYVQKFSGSILRAYYISGNGYGWRVHSGSTASNVHQKPAHTKEREAIAQHFFSDKESSFTIKTRDDIPFILNGKFGLDFDDVLLYIESAYNVEYLSFGSAKGDYEAVYSVSSKVKNILRTVPFHTLAHTSPSTVIYINLLTPEIEESFHYPGVLFLRRHSISSVSEGSYMRLTPRNVRDQLKTREYNLVVAGSRWSDR